MAGNNEGERLAIEYYMTCEEMTDNPFKFDIVEGKRAIQDLQANTQILNRIANQYLPLRVRGASAFRICFQNVWVEHWSEKCCSLVVRSLVRIFLFLFSHSTCDFLPLTFSS